MTTRILPSDDQQLVHIAPPQERRLDQAPTPARLPTSGARPSTGIAALPSCTRTRAATTTGSGWTSPHLDQVVLPIRTSTQPPKTFRSKPVSATPTARPAGRVSLEPPAPGHATPAMHPHRRRQPGIPAPGDHHKPATPAVTP
ncbi:hypothetical protein AB0F52_00980 [Amycolatopsis sp. NPDC024027]|uniref:hypothetical protein n=1 Tax=Amycolatopsis sp. NPDC024027 TaxID=3154327 RepID=UPI0033C5332C